MLALKMALYADTDVSVCGQQPSYYMPLQAFPSWSYWNYRLIPIILADFFAGRGWGLLLPRAGIALGLNIELVAWIEPKVFSKGTKSTKMFLLHSSEVIFYLEENWFHIHYVIF